MVCSHACTTAHIHILSSVRVCIWGMDYSELKKKSKVVLMIFLTLLLSHSLFPLFSFLVLSLSFSALTALLIVFLVACYPSHSSSILTPCLYNFLPSIFSRNIHKMTFSVSSSPLFSTSVSCFLCHHYPVF